jgi:hypothetical protein
LNEHPERSAWLPPPPGTPDRTPEAPAAQPPDRAPSEPEASTSSVEQKRIREAYEARIAELSRRLEELERALRAANARASAAGASGNRDDHGRIELNTATVEGLRELGLSITQAARLVALREARGGLASLDELDEVPGLPEAQRAALRGQIYIDEATVRHA